MNHTTTKKRGGKQPNSGRPPKEREEKFKKVRITMSPEQYLVTNGDRSGIIRRALDLYLIFEQEKKNRTG